MGLYLCERFGISDKGESWPLAGDVFYVHVERVRHESQVGENGKAGEDRGRRVCQYDYHCIAMKKNIIYAA